LHFLLNIFKLKQELYLYSCNIIAFLHKIDERSNSYVNQKVKIIEDFITVQHPQGQNFKIYTTSIKKDFFYNTYTIISEILNLIFENKLIYGFEQKLQELRKELSLVINLEINLKYKRTDLVHKFKIGLGSLTKYLKKLENLGFIKTFDEYNSFQLTDNAYYFKIGFEKEYNIDKEYFNKRVESFYIILCLKEKEQGFQNWGGYQSFKIFHI
jgi:hypothetical protein